MLRLLRTVAVESKYFPCYPKQPRRPLTICSLSHSSTLGCDKSHCCSHTTISSSSSESESSDSTHLCPYSSAGCSWLLESPKAPLKNWKLSGLKSPVSSKSFASNFRIIHHTVAVFPLKKPSTAAFRSLPTKLFIPCTPMVATHLYKRICVSTTRRPCRLQPKVVDVASLTHPLVRLEHLPQTRIVFWMAKRYFHFLQHDLRHHRLSSHQNCA
jgi:hypothetical protein